MIGVVAAGAPAMLHSYEQQRVLTTKSAVTIADGIAVREPVPYAVESMLTTVDEVVAVDETAILRAMRLIHEHLGLVIEPAGAVGVAALLASPERWAGRRIATVLCGGNVSPEQIRAWLG